MRSSRPFLQAAMSVAARQYGLLTWAQAHVCGLNAVDVRRLLRQGAWGRPFPRVYSVRALLDRAAQEERLHTLVMAAQLALGPAAFAGAQTAARL